MSSVVLLLRVYVLVTFFWFEVVNHHIHRWRATKCVEVNGACCQLDFSVDVVKELGYSPESKGVNGPNLHVQGHHVFHKLFLIFHSMLTKSEEIGVVSSGGSSPSSVKINWSNAHKGMTNTGFSRGSETFFGSSPGEW